MTYLVIGLAVLLVLAILYATFRVATLVGIVKGEGSKNVPSSNKLQASLLVVFLILGLFGFFYYSFGGLDESFVNPIASEHGVATDRLFWITMGLTGFVFVVTQIFLFGFAYKYQFKENGQAHFYPHNDNLEKIWTIVPAIVLAVLIFSGWRTWVDITSSAPEDSEKIEIMGYQYSWAVRYGGNDKKLGDYDYQKIDVVNQSGIDFSDKASFDDFIPTRLYLPKGRPVLLQIRARDVIHSVYQPHFRLQMNAVPGMPTRFWFTPTKTTEEMRVETGNPEFDYELVCNKICGKGHFAMKYMIEVLEPEEYDKWYAEASQNPWLKQNSDYLAHVPEELQELARISSGIDSEEDIESIDNTIASINY